jgi:hypothetical protein
MPDIILAPQNSWQAIMMLIGTIMAMVVINIIPLLGRPFNLFFTLIHELGHVFATGLTRGEIVSFSLFSNDSGLARWRGGDNVLIYSAGYMGTTVFSAGLMILNSLPDLASLILGLLGGLLLLTVLLYGWQSRPAMLVGLGFSLLFITIAWILPPSFSIFTLYVLAFQGAFTALLHLLQLGRNLSGTDDASRMSQRVGCAPLFWVRVWLVSSILTLGAAFWFTWLRTV